MFRVPFRCNLMKVRYGKCHFRQTENIIGHFFLVLKMITDGGALISLPHQKRLRTAMEGGWECQTLWCHADGTKKTTITTSQGKQFTYPC